MDINIKEFGRRYDENYEWLYDGGDQASEYMDWVDAFDSFLQTHSEFVGEFAKYRGDCISSDREAAAFMLTLNAFVEVSINA